MQCLQMRCWLPLALLLGVSSCLQHSAVLDPEGDVVIHWTPDDDGNSIVIQVEARTRGWAAIGFSPNGGMTGSDIVLGWVANGQTHVQDMHAVGNRSPLLDARSDVEPMGGVENDTHTVFTFRRPLRVCDTEQDRSLGLDTTRVIWALHELDPAPGDGPSYHGVRRGSRSLLLDGTGVFRYPAAGEAESFVLGAAPIALPARQTFYHCAIEKIPDFGQKVHYTGYRIKLDPVSRPYVHHLVLFSCYVPEHMFDEFEDYYRSHPGTECYSKNMPPRWAFCNDVIVAWAVGGEGDMLPDHVGIPLGHQHGGSTFFMVETHYDNPHKHAGIKDSSGVQILYSRELRPVEASMLTTGIRVSSAQIIPPGQKQFVSTGICHESCTAQELPSEGVRVHSVILHAHLAGRSLRLRHIRNGRELPPVAQDESYDFNFQQSRTVSEDVRIMPGDSLMLECGYNTEDRNQTLLGGFSTTNEMCLAFILYYPRARLTRCQSHPHIGHYLEALGVKTVEMGGQQLPPVKGGDLWTKAGAKMKADRFNQILTAKEMPKLTTDGSGADRVSRGDWFNRLQLSTMNVTESEGESFVTLYKYLTEMTWEQSDVDRLQNVASVGPKYHYCKNDLPVAQQDVANEMSQLAPAPAFEPLVQETATCAEHKAVGSSAGRAVGATLALLASVGRLLL